MEGAINLAELMVGLYKLTVEPTVGLYKLTVEPFKSSLHGRSAASSCAIWFPWSGGYWKLVVRLRDVGELRRFVNDHLRLIEILAELDLPLDLGRSPSLKV